MKKMKQGGKLISHRLKAEFLFKTININANLLTRSFEFVLKDTRIINE